MSKKVFGRHMKFTEEWTNREKHGIDAWYCENEKVKGVCFSLADDSDGRLQELYVTNAQLKQLGYTRKE
jgi:hypothetical protein